MKSVYKTIESILPISNTSSDGYTALTTDQSVALTASPDLNLSNQVDHDSKLDNSSRLKYTKLAIALFGIAFCIWTLEPIASTTLTPYLVAISEDIAPVEPPATRVGPRSFPNLYHGQGCNSTQLLYAVSQARIREDGASRFDYEPAHSENVNDFDLDAFKFSYDLEGCPPPHMFTAAQACDLLSAFGGIRTQGDSLMRQFAQGLFLLLTNSFDQVEGEQWHQECSGNELFTHGRECKFHSIYDTRKMKHVCPEEPFVQYDQVWRFVSEKTNPKPEFANWDYNASQPLIGTYNEFVASLPEKRRQYSPVFVNGVGIHYKFKTEPTINGHILPFLRNAAEVIPQPLKFWSAYPAPGINKPKNQLAGQGPEAVKAYNAQVERILHELSPGAPSLGAWTPIDWFNTTDGALSYDGTHYSFIVAMERAQIFLNLLDLVWGEVVALGGLVEEDDHELTDTVVA